MNRFSTGVGILSILAGAFAAQSQPMTLLRGHRPAAFARLAATGELTITTNLPLTIGLPLRNVAELNQLLQRIYDPASPDYGHYLTPEEFTARFGPTAEQYKTAVDYASSHGLTVTAMHANRLLFNATGAVGDIEKVFHTHLRVYQHPTEARKFFAPDTDPSVTPDFPILDVSGLDNFMPPRPMDLRKADGGAPQTVANVTGSGPGGLFIGNDFRAAYAPGVTLNGTGQTVGLFEFGNYFSADVTDYEQRAGLQNINITNVSVNGFGTTPAAGTDDGEEALDVQMAISMAPAAKLMVYEGNDADSILNQIASDNKAKQIGCSFGWYPPDQTLNSILLELSVQGQSFFVASGDGGAYTPASTIYAPTDFTNIICVGGTSLTTAGRRGPWVSETGWVGSGGGVSSTFAIPSFQKGISMTANEGSTTMRNIPDVSCLADTIIFTFNENGSSGGIGGTSAATPLWAGFMALVNEQAAANGRPALGTLNNTLYSVGKSALGATAYHDITTGNDFNGSSPGKYSAVAGYDLVTGWGTPNGTNMLNALGSATDAMQIRPGFGFGVFAPWGSGFPQTNATLTVSNSGANGINVAVGGGAPWLDLTASPGPLAAGATMSVSAALDTAAASNLVAGTYTANVWFTNQTTGIVESRLFVLTISSTAAPLTLNGFNASVIAPKTATSAQPHATSFDIPNGYAFFETGLNGSSEGLPTGGAFISGWDGLTEFQLAPYGVNDALMMGGTYPSSGSLTLANPQAFDSIVILASSANANSSSAGTLTLHFADGSSSQAYNFNAQDWFNVSSNSALAGFGRVKLTGLSTEDDGGSNPNFYQTTINLAAAGFNQPLQSITFSKPSSASSTGVFAISGALMPPGPAIGQQPQSVTNTAPSSSATITVAAMGAPPLSYQWFDSSGNAVAGATSSKLVFNPVIPTSSAGNYHVVVSNNYGAVTSAAASLVVYRDPLITQQAYPSNFVWLQGAGGTISVGAVGASPLTETWLLNGSPIAGASGLSYTVKNAQPSDSGVYTLVLSNAYGSLTSAPVSVTVTPAYAPFARGALGLKPLAYWRLDETNGTTAHDFVHENNGVYHSVTLGRAGYDSTSSPKTDPNELAAQFGGSQSYVGIPTIDLSVPQGGNGEFAVAAWVNASTSISTDAGIVTKGYGGGDEQFNLDCGGGGHAFRFFVRDVASGNAFLSTSSTTPDNRWHYLVGVCDQVHSNVTLYVDGVAATKATIPGKTGIHSTTIPASIGSREGGAGQTYNYQFIGEIGDVAIFTNALTAAQVSALYNAAKSGPAIQQEPAALWQGSPGGSATNDVVAAGAGLSYQWYGPSGVLTGQTAAALALDDLQPADAGDYYVVVNNSFGSAQSSVGTLTLAPGAVSVQALAGGQLQLNWPAGTLQSAPAVNGPYTDVTNATAPYMVSPTNAQQFFRLRLQ